MAPPFLFDGPEDAPLTVALAHGAGAAMDTPFMTTIAGGLAAAGWRCARFEFPYMRRRREDGRRRPPDREPVLREAFAEAVAALGTARLVIGGKSMGGRIASLVADDLGVRGLVCLGYPFHAPGKPDRVRADHLRAIATPTLILQGTRDPFGTRAEVAGYARGASVAVRFLEDGKHSFKPRRAGGRTEADNLAEAVAATAAFLDGLART